jgi:phosphatidylserine decarboxylase
MAQARLIVFHDLATVRDLSARNPHRMPLHFGKIFGAIAVLTVAAFVLWLIVTTWFATEQADQQIERTGAVELGSGGAG